jgi:hypothetical protein
MLSRPALASHNSKIKHKDLSYHVPIRCQFSVLLFQRLTENTGTNFSPEYYQVPVFRFGGAGAVVVARH